MFPVCLLNYTSNNANSIRLLHHNIVLKNRFYFLQYVSFVYTGSIIA